MELLSTDHQDSTYLQDASTWKKMYNLFISLSCEALNSIKMI